VSNLAKWGEWGDDAVKQDLSALNSGQRNYMKLTEGDNIVRFLPPKIGKPSPFAVTYSHYMELPDGRKVSFNCPRMMGEKKRPCMVCAKGDQLRASRNMADQKAGKRLFPRLRVYANVVDRNDEGAGIKILAFGKGVLESLTAIRQNARKGGNFTHPLTGRDIIITRKGTGQFDTEYIVNPDVQASPLSHDELQADAWIEASYDLDSFLTVLDDAAIQAKIRGEEAPQEQPRTMTVKPKGRTIEDDADSFDPDSF